MKISFENKVALVTGAGSGLGLATVRAFAEAGASVVLADWHEESVRSAAKKLTVQGYKALAIRCDVSNESEVEDMVRNTIATFGRSTRPTIMPACKTSSRRLLIQPARTTTG